jgi:quinol monooxygenase YgiN
MSEIVVVASAKAQAGREDDVAQALRTNADASRREAGCISYGVLRGDNRAFMTIERWRSRADFESHMGTAHVQTLLHTITPMLASPPDIQVLEEL